MARTYKRDSRGRFASGGSSSSSSSRARPGQNQRGLARASKSAMETRRVKASGGAWDSKTAGAKIDRTNRTAANAQAAYGSKRSTARKQGAPRRTVEARLERSRQMRESGINRVRGAKRITSEIKANARLHQHRRAVDNYIAKQKNRKKAELAAWWNVY